MDSTPLTSLLMDSSTISVQQHHLLENMTLGEHDISSFSAASANSSTVVNIDPKIQQRLQSLFVESLTAYDNMRVFQYRQQQSSQIKQYDTVREAMAQFIQKRPSDELLLHESEYVFERKQRILVNLVAEMIRIDRLVPTTSSNFDYKAHFQVIGKRCKQHMNNVLPRLGYKTLFDQNPAGVLASLLLTYLDILGRFKKTLMDSDNRLKINPDETGISVKDISQLRQGRGNRITNLWADEKVILADKRKELDVIDMEVTRIVIACERINYYTAGIIMPRDQDLATITYKQQSYDIQTCMQVQSLIKNQIERVEQIEKQMCMMPDDDDDEGDQFSQGQRQRITTQKLNRDSQYFDLTQKPGIKEKQKFRESFVATDMKKNQRAQERSQQIWHEFIESSPSGAPLEACRTNLHIKIKSLFESFMLQGLHITLQLVSMGSGHHSEPQCLQDSTQSWYFTEIPFVQDIVVNDLALLVKVFRYVQIPASELKSRQRINSISDEPMEIKVCVAFKVVNLSFLLFDERLTDGKQTSDSEALKFVINDPARLNIDQDWAKVLVDSKDLKLQTDEKLTQLLNMKLRYCFLTSADKSMLSMRLDLAETIRRRNFHIAMVNQLNLSQEDPTQLLAHEMSKFNCNMLHQHDSLNELSIHIDTMTLEKSKIVSPIYKLQAFLVYHDRSEQNQALNHKFNAVFYEQSVYDTSKQFRESFQTPLCTIMKNGKVYFKTDLNMHLPVTQKAQDLANFKLIFVVYIAREVNQNDGKQKEKLTEQMFLDEKFRQRYTFVPYYYGRLPLIDQWNRLMGSQRAQVQLPLMRYNYSKYLHAQLDLPMEQSPGVSVNFEFSLLSQHFTQNEHLRTLIEQKNVSNLVTFVQLISENDMLLYQTRILYALLWNLYSQKETNDAMTALVNIFERYQYPVMAPYKSLIENFTERWRSDRVTESKIWSKLFDKIEHIPDEIQHLLSRPLSEDVFFQIKEVATYMKHLPSFLQLICKLFTSEFKQKYAQIGEMISRNFRPFLQSDLAQYREDLVDTSLTPTQEMCSKPAIIVKQLMQAYDRINHDMAKTYDQQIAEANAQDQSSYGDDDVNDPDQLQQQQQKLIEGQQESQQRNKSITKKKLSELYREIRNLMDFQVDFCTRIKQIVIKISKALHQEAQLADSTDLGPSVRRALHLISQQEKARAKLDQLESDQRKNPNEASAKKLAETREQEHQLKSEINSVVAQVVSPLFERVKNLLINSERDFMTLIERRKDLKKIFWRNLQQILQVCINFIDRKFVMNLFDEQYLLKKVDRYLDRLVEQMVPEFETVTKIYSPIYKLLLEQVTLDNVRLNLRLLTSASEFSLLVEQEQKKLKATETLSEDQLKPALIESLKECFKRKAEECQLHMKKLRKLEFRQTELQVYDKVRMFASLVSSDTFILLPSDQQSFARYNAGEFQSVQEVVAANISAAVHQHLKQFQRKGGKDTTASELQYLFLYQMAVFEKKFAEFTTQVKLQLEACLMVQVDEQETSEQFLTSNKDEVITLSELQKSYRIIRPNDDEQDNNGIFSAAPSGRESLRADGKLTQQQDVSGHTSGLHNNTPVLHQHFAINRDGGSVMGLGATQADMGSQDLRIFFRQGQDKRLCYFLNEIENTLGKFKELKQGSQELQVPELKEMKLQYISLFEVLCIQSLSHLSHDAFRRLYSNRPGCLDRLVSQVRNLLSLSLEFTQEEFFLKVRKFLVISQFCALVTDLLCEDRSRKYIAELQDKYTYKSIISQVWLLSKQLQVQQVDLWAEDSARMQMKLSNSSFVKQTPNATKFLQDSGQKLNYSQRLWQTYKEIGDLILPASDIDLFKGIQSKIQSLLNEDLDDKTLTTVRSEKLEYLLKPLAVFIVQLDELTHRNKGQLSYRCLMHVETFMLEIISFKYQGSNIAAGANSEKWEQLLLDKKKLILNYFVEQFEEHTSQEIKDLKFREALAERLGEIRQLRTLYIAVMEYEPTQFRPDCHLLAQLIQFYKLMLLLQKKQAQISFLNNIQQKYGAMVANINAKLEAGYRAELKKEETSDGMFVCQKSATQYVNQMREVTAFMQVEDYYTYKQALKDDKFAQMGIKTTHDRLNRMIEKAVQLLVPTTKSNNQFYDVALQLMQDKRHAEEESYQFDAVAQTLVAQKQLYRDYDQKFEQKAEYCKYYRVQIEPFLPQEMQEPGRIFVYRTPSGYTLDFLKHDLALLTGQDEVRYSKQCEVRPLKPFTADIRQMYSIAPDCAEISETPEEITSCPQKYKQYFHQNFKKQFYVEQCPTQEPAEFDDQYILTVYEVEKPFPTMSMVQEVTRCIKEWKVPRVEVQLWEVKKVLKELAITLQPTQQLIAVVLEEPQTQNDQSLTQTAIHLVKKYLTNDDVGGGLPKILELFFSEQKAQQFKALENLRLTRLYLELFKGLELWLAELAKVVEKYLREGESGELGELATLAKTRLEERRGVMKNTKEKYELNLVQENF